MLNTPNLHNLLRWPCLLLQVVLLGWLCPVSGNEGEVIIKAAYVRNALNFAEWLKGTFPSRNTPFKLGVAGNPTEMMQSLELAFT